MRMGAYIWISRRPRMGKLGSVADMDVYGVVQLFVALHLGVMLPRLCTVLVCSCST